jgi:hypothetical protein
MNADKWVVSIGVYRRLSAFIGGWIIFRCFSAACYGTGEPIATAAAHAARGAGVLQRRRELAG